ncbi:MAG TPA: hypothetical protein PLY70_04875 [Saprospiraceae bacterium]|nr:hypothetical protein [Saprospiraceae bacterium]HPN69209.1 hypothetical protein [Saprospiraceae bacterium]
MMTEAQVKFLELIKTCFEQQSKASLILDINGLEKIQGLISVIEEDKSNVLIKMDNGFTFSLNQVIAINGYFDPLYSMC